jgi:hypothetical protein
VTSRQARTTKKQRDAAVARVLRGESTAEREAKRLHVSPAIIKRYVTKATTGVEPLAEQPISSSGAPSAAQSPPASSEGSSPPPIEVEAERLDDSPLARALRAAGLPEEEIKRQVDEEEGRVPENEPPAGPDVPLDPDELVAFAESSRTAVIDLIAIVCAVPIEDPVYARVQAMPDRIRKSLRMLAPFAARDVGPAIAESGSGAAFLFCGLLLVSVIPAGRELRKAGKDARAKQAAEEEKKQAEHDAAQRAGQAPSPNGRAAHAAPPAQEDGKVEIIDGQDPRAMHAGSHVSPLL